MLRELKWMTLAAILAVAASSGGASATEARYDCNGGTQLTAQFSPPGANGRVALTFATGRKVELPQVVSADGGRYADADMEFWIKGRNATLTRGSSRETCAAK